mmetsp:Transcript_642/g.1740  ORF Transcript_642/g.1740 Transcript_642/m.1740 type:complete len:151 (-) Transcript_642:1803-2255(-)
MRVQSFPLSSLLLSARTSTLLSSRAPISTKMSELEVDKEYPGTAVARMRSAVERAKSLSSDDLSGEWEDTRKKLLWAAGLRDLQNVPPGQGNTGHAFNDHNHCDATVQRMMVKTYSPPCGSSGCAPQLSPHSHWRRFSLPRPCWAMLHII